jgi:hypothetical protein
MITKVHPPFYLVDRVCGLKNHGVTEGLGCLDVILDCDGRSVSGLLSGCADLHILPP